VKRSAVLDLLRAEPAFRWLWLSQVVSELGDWFQIVAIVSMFPTRGDGATIIAGLVVARHVVADRYDRGRVMIASDLSLWLRAFRRHAASLDEAARINPIR
jgi:hypothetical protein